MKVKVDNVGDFNLTDKNFVASGGQAKVFAKQQHAIKIYHDVTKMPPSDKLKQLSVLDIPNVLGPQHLVRDMNGKVVGYTMPFVKDTVPMCKVFTLSFKQDHNISPSDIVELVKQIQLTTMQIHKHGILIVDGNEMNYLVNNTFDIPYFIDVDSWQTKDYPADALMESVRDRLIQRNQFTEMSDWFSFAVVSFQLYTGIHPYKGKHPDYKPKDWLKRMDAGISVFDPKVTLPPTVADFSVIPKRHLDWYEDVFKGNKRSVPPMPDGVVPAHIGQDIIRVIQGTESFDTQLIFSFDERIRDAIDLAGTMYFIGKDHIFRGDNTKRPIDDLGNARKIAFGRTPNGTPIIAKWQDEKHLTFSKPGGGGLIQVTGTSAIMGRDNRIYNISDDRLFVNEFIETTRGQLMHSASLVGNVLPLAGKMFGNMIYQDILGKPWIMIPTSEHGLFFKHITELDDYRVMDGYSQGNFAVIIAEKDGVLSRFVLVFDWRKQTYTCRRTDDVSNIGISMAVNDAGICVLMTDHQEIEIFKDNATVKTVGNTPFDASMRLFAHGTKIYFIDRKNVYSVAMKGK